MMFVSERMSTPALTIRTDVDYQTALRLMQERALHHLPVVDARDQLVGVVAERDLLLAATHHMQTVLEVGEIMHRAVITTTPEMPIGEAAQLMVNHKIGGLPVVDADQRVVGMITETDIFHAFVELIDPQSTASST
jgi:acetoin utilization protein AcuB